MKIELTIQEARTGDALKAKGQIILTVNQWRQLVSENNWLLDEWDDEFKEWIQELFESVQAPQQPSIVTPDTK